MINIKTKSGLEVDIIEENITDMRFIEAAAKSEENAIEFVRMIELAIGSKGKEKLYKHCTDENGRIPIEKVNAEFEEILTIAAERNNNVKN